MNYGAWYPPTTYSASPAFNNASSGASYRGGYPATTSGGSSYALPYANATSASHSYGQYANSTQYATAGQYAAASHYATSGPSNTGNFPNYGNGFTAASGAATTASYDPVLLAAVANISFGSK